MFNVLDKIFNISEFYIAESSDVFNGLGVNIKTHIQYDVYAIELARLYKH